MKSNREDRCSTGDKGLIARRRSLLRRTMRLDISDVLREVGKILPYEIHEPPLVDEDVECTKPIEGRVTFNNTGGTLLVRGHADTSVALACSRCAQYFERPVHLVLEEQFELRHESAGPRTLKTVTIVDEDAS